MIPSFDQIVQLPSADSTNDDAFQLLAHCDNCLVWTTDQRKGRGSRGREWVSPPNTSLALSIGLNDFQGVHQNCFPLFTGLLVQRILRGLMPAGHFSLKWPNDILLEGRKLSGILCESRWQGSKGRVVLGVGLNLRRNPALEDLERGYAALDEIGDPPPPQRIVEAVPDAFRACLEQTGGQQREIVAAWMKSSWLLPGTQVVVMVDTEITSGTYHGLDPEGAMVIRDAMGSQHLIRQSTDDIIVKQS